MRTYAAILVSALALLHAAPAGAQDPEGEPLPLPELPGATPLPDMTFAEFRERRLRLREKVNTIRERKCREPVRFGTWTRYIKPWRRDENLAHWRERIPAQRAKRSLCWDGRYWINRIFGVYAGQAKTVAWCESKFSVNATNGQYVGIFQMGYVERRTYGWYTVGARAEVQVRSAHNYFVASGRDWSPWECKP